MYRDPNSPVVPYTVIHADIFFYRKRQLEIPPDPRDHFERRSELVSTIMEPPCYTELEALHLKYKAKPVKAWPEDKLNKQLDRLCAQKKPNEKAKEQVVEQLNLKFLAEARKAQQLRIKEWEREINGIDGKFNAKLTVENEADLEGPPRHMNYITAYKVREGKRKQCLQ